MRCCECFGLTIRLVWGALSLGIALLAVLPAPTALLWQVAVAVTEFGHWLALPCLLPWLPGWRRSRGGRVGAALGLGAAALMLSSVARAIPVAQQLPQALNLAFGAYPPRADDASLRPAPLVALDLFRGVTTPTITPRTLVYRVVAGQSLALDYYPPRGAAPAPLVIVVHGGSWRRGDSSELAALNPYLAARGYAVAAINYRLAPRWIFPAAADDLRAAVAFLKSQAQALGLDPTRIALLGRSAGGQLALLHAYTAADPAIRAVVAFYPPTDLPYAYLTPTNPAVIDTPGTLAAYLGGTPEQVPSVYQAASPIMFVGPHSPPTLLIHGARDELVRYAQSVRLVEKLRAAGRPQLLLTLPWATHGADFNFSGPSGQLSTYAIERLLAATLR